MSTQDSAGFQIHIMDRAALPSTLRTHHLELEPTCIEFCVVRGQRHILAVLWQIDHTSVCLYPVDTDGTGPVLEIRILAGISSLPSSLGDMGDIKTNGALQKTDPIPTDYEPHLRRSSNLPFRPSRALPLFTNPKRRQLS